MTPNEWTSLCDKYWKNKEGLGFHPKIKPVSDGRFELSTDADPKYEPALKKIMIAMAQGAVSYAIASINTDNVEEKDKNTYVQKWTANVKENSLTFIQILLEYGQEKFLEHIFLEQTRHEMSYILEKTHPRLTKDGSIVFSAPGHVYWNGAWHNKKNESVPLFDNTLNWGRILQA